MEKIAIIILAITSAISSAYAQDVAVDGLLKSPLTCAKLLFIGTSIELKDATIICDVLEIQSSVSQIKINGKVKIVCKQKIINGNTSAINILAGSSGQFTFEKPTAASDIAFKLSTPDVEFKRVSNE